MDIKYTSDHQLALIKATVMEASESVWPSEYTDRALTAIINTPVDIDLPGLRDDGDVDEDNLSDSERVRLGLDFFGLDR